MIKLVDDVVAPLVVTALDIGVTAMKPEYNEWASYIAAGAGYLGAWQGYGGDFVKNIGIASFPWAAKNLYMRAKAMTAPKTTGASRMSRSVSETVMPDFRGVNLV